MARAWQLTGRPQYRRLALATRDYLRGRMMAPDGGFYSAEDAAAQGEEGASYLWSRPEIEAVLGSDADRFLSTYTLTPMPEQADPLEPEAARSVLRVRRPTDGSVDRAELQIASLEHERRKLLAARDARAQPARDEKLLVGWNGLAIDAFVISGKVFHSRQDIAIARRTAERIWSLAWSGQDGRLSHEIFRGRAQGIGFLEDYALLGRSFLSLREATNDELWLRRARLLAEALLRQFDLGGDILVSASSGVGALIATPVDEGDGAYPCGTSSAVALLAKLGRVDRERPYADIAARFASRASRHPESWPSLLAAVATYYPSAGANSPHDSTTGPKEQPTGETARHVHASATSRWFGSQREVVITLDIERGYHINANPASFDFLIPTSVTFNDVQPVEVRYPVPKLFRPSFAPDTLNVYEGTVQLLAKLDSGTLNGVRRLSLTVNTQACTETVCLPPSRIPLTIRMAP